MIKEKSFHQDTNQKIDNYESRMLATLKEISPDGNYSEETIKKAIEKIESEKVTFYVAEHGLETSVDEVISNDEYIDRDTDDFEPNRNWYSITVENEADKKEWVRMKNEWLSCAWTPNQNNEERTENAERMRELAKQMRELEV
ncbi:hypothetical protein KAI52_03550 [Candidatus Parcubacteria bacterium]|nr:hypothetical protein [Candidatus Parcubacteria bacterium]